MLHCACLPASALRALPTPEPSACAWPLAHLAVRRFHGVVLCQCMPDCSSFVMFSAYMQSAGLQLHSFLPSRLVHLRHEGCM